MSEPPSVTKVKKNLEAVEKSAAKESDIEEAPKSGPATPTPAPSGNRPGSFKFKAFDDDTDAFSGMASSSTESYKSDISDSGERSNDRGRAVLRQKYRDIDKQIKLRIGNSVFHTSIATLQKANFFVVFFLLKSHEQAPPDDTYFLDADGDMFRHILTYLRHGTGPLFWTKEGGFDYSSYTTLHKQASFFRILKLVKWIDQKLYRLAIQEFVSCESVVMKGSLDQLILENFSCHGLHKRIISAQPFIEKQYECPRGVAVHDSPTDCGIKCSKLAPKGALSACYKEVPMTRVLVEQRDFIVIHGSLNVSAGLGLRRNLA